MSRTPSELEQFRQFIAEQLAVNANETPEACLSIWRASHPLQAELAESIAAVKEGLEQAKRGEGIPFDDFMRGFKMSRGIANHDE